MRNTKFDWGQSAGRRLSGACPDGKFARVPKRTSIELYNFPEPRTRKDFATCTAQLSLSRSHEKAVPLVWHSRRREKFA
ncbi:MAG: hypothetical protein GX184_02205 [Clostridiaceae bacterium]|nr:hypothetical protein [Clostridiaceae bacterium]